MRKLIPVLLLFVSLPFTFSGCVSRMSLVGPNGHSESDNIPGFPIPPPKPTLQKNFRIDKNKLQTFEQVDAVLKTALNDNRYPLNYYKCTNGFVIVTDVEKYDPQTGAYMSDPASRFSTTVLKPTDFFDDPIRAVTETFAGLMGTRTGYFRLYVFMITNADISATSHTPPAFETARKWTESNCKVLPRKYRPLKVTDDYELTVLTYLYKREENQEPVFQNGSNMTADQHLRLSKLYDGITKNNYIHE